VLVQITSTLRNLLFRYSGAAGCAVLLLVPFTLGLYGIDEPSAGTLSEPLRIMIALILASVIGGSIVQYPVAGFSILAAFLPFLGFIRRGLIPTIGYQSNEPLTLIGAAVGTLLFVRIASNRWISTKNITVKLAIALLGVMFLQIFNPKQGGILVGLGGALFYIGPLMWFFVARHHGNKQTLSNICSVILFTSVIAAIVGLRQQFVEMSDVEKYWMVVSKYRQVLSNDTVRVFGIALSFGEYVTLMSMGAMVAWSRFLQRKYLYALPFAFIAASIFLSSSRGGVIMLLAGCIVSWSFLDKRSAKRLPRILVGVGLGVLGLQLGLSQTRALSLDRTSAVFVEHQVEGLSNPFGSERSTATKHVGLMEIGFMSGIKNPIGQGLGSTTIAGRRFNQGGTDGEDGTFSTELDFTNIIVSTGFVGGILYLVLMGRMSWVIIKLWDVTRASSSLEWIAIAIVTFGNWLQGGYYAPSILIWSCYGIMDKLLEQEGVSVRPGKIVNTVMSLLPQKFRPLSRTGLPNR
jgi:hypothetical protein